MQQFATRPDRDPSVRILRWAVVALGLGLGLALLVMGNVLIGVLVTGLAALRIALLLRIDRRRRPFRDSTRSGPTRPGLRRLTPTAVETAARTIGITGTDLRAELAAGRSIDEVAASQGVPTEQVVEAVAAEAAARIDEAVASGMLAPVRADRARAHLSGWATDLIRTGHAYIA